jgi:DNA-binding transcriptional MerR regulator
MAREFSTTVTTKLTRATRRMLGHWAKTGIMRPSGREASGKGTRRRYTFRDLVAIQTILDLRARGCPLQKIRAAVEFLRLHYPQDSNSDMLSRLTLLTDGVKVFVLTDERQAMEVLTGQAVWTVPLGLRIIETDERVRKLPQVWTEEVAVHNKTFHLRIAREGEKGVFTAICRELPGTLQRAQTAEKAITQATESIVSVLAYMRQQGHPIGHMSTQAIG